MYNLLTKLTLLTVAGIVSGSEPGQPQPICPPGQWCKPNSYGGCECCAIPPNPCFPPETGHWDVCEWICKPIEATCPKTNWNYLINGNFDEKSQTVRLQDGRIVPVANLHKPIRVIRSGDPIPLDYNPNRLNIEISWVNNCWKICKVWCG